MNKYLLLICLFMALHSHAGDKQFAIVFYNVENLFHPSDDPQRNDEEFTPGGSYKYTHGIYKQKLQNIARVLADMGKASNAVPCIIGLAEVENDEVLKDLAALPAIEKLGYKYICFKGPDPRGINTALLYDVKQFRLLNAKPLIVPLNAEPTRSVLFASGILAGDTVYVLVNHWPSRREGKEKTAPDRMAAARVNKHIADSVLQLHPSAKLVIMGDLNDNPDNESITAGLGADSLGKQGLYNPWQSIYSAGKGTVLYKKHWDLFDQVILSSSFRTGKGLKYDRAEIFKKDYLITQNGKFLGYPHRSFGGTRWLNGYSDHLPVIIYLKKH